MVNHVEKYNEKLNKMEFKLFAVYIGRKSSNKLLELVNKGIINRNNFVTVKIEEIGKKFERDSRIVEIGFPLENGFTKDLIDILHENRIPYDVRGI